MCAQKKKQDRVPAKEFGVKIKLGVKERLMIAQILPREGNLIAQRIMRDIVTKTELSQAEMDQVGMEGVEGGGVKWDDKKEAELGQKLVKFTDAEIGYLKDEIKKLDEKGKISRDTFQLCERIHNLKTGEEKEKEVAPS